MNLVNPLFPKKLQIITMHKHSKIQIYTILQCINLARFSTNQIDSFIHLYLVYALQYLILLGLCMVFFIDTNQLQIANDVEFTKLVYIRPSFCWCD